MSRAIVLRNEAKTLGGFICTHPGVIGTVLLTLGVVPTMGAYKAHSNPAAAAAIEEQLLRTAGYIAAGGLAFAGASLGSMSSNTAAAGTMIGLCIMAVSPLVLMVAGLWKAGVAIEEHDPRFAISFVAMSLVGVVLLAKECVDYRNRSRFIVAPAAAPVAIVANDNVVVDPLLAASAVVGQVVPSSTYGAINQ